MKKVILTTSAIVLLAGTPIAFAHCEVPCGIYDDKARVDLIHEHIGTIEKSMTKIKELSKESSKNYNQIVRWVNNKEDHASKIQDIVFQYFMTQRIKPVSPESEWYDKYIKELTLLHNMLVSAMKTKQSTDMAHTEDLHEYLENFSKSYFGKMEKREKK